MPDFSAPGPDAGLTSLANGLNSLAGGLFPDPSKIAQAGYYGAETRRARAQAQLIEDQTAAQGGLPDLITRALQGGGAPGQPGQAAPPGPQGPAPAPMPAPTAAAPTPGQGQATPPVPAVVPPTPQSVSLADTITNFLNPGGAGSNVAGTTGPQPAVASPAPDSGTQPGPNITGTDGKPIPQDDASGTIHPGSVLPPSTVQTQTGPAASNGAPAASMLPQIMATAVKAYGGNVDGARGLVGAVIGSMVLHNQLSHQQAAEYLSELGNNAMYESDQATGRNAATIAGANTRQAMQDATNITTTGMTNDAAQRRQDTLPYAVAGPDGTSGVVATQRTAPGHPVFDQELNRTLKTPGTFIGPDQQPVTSTPGQAVTPGSGLHKPSGAEETLSSTQNTPENFIDNRTGAAVFISPKVAAAAPPGTYTKQTLAQTQPVTVMRPGGGPLVQVPAAVAQTRGLPLQPSAPPEDLKNSFPLIKGALLEDLARRYALQSTHTMSNNTEDATLPPALMAEAQRRVAAYKQWGPPMPDGAIAPQVISDMQQDGLIPKENTPPAQGGLDRSVSLGDTAGRFVTENKLDKAGNPTNQTVKRILIPALPNPPTAPTSWSGRALRGELSGAVAQQPAGAAASSAGQGTTGGMPANAYSAAPPGMAEGTPVAIPGSNMKGVVRNGYVVPEGS